MVRERRYSLGTRAKGMLMEVTTLDVLLLARDIQARGLCKGALEDGRGNRCMLGAFGAAERVLGLDYTKAQSIDGYLALAAITGGVPEFNNAPERTLADVLAAFDHAIAVERQRLGIPEPVESESVEPEAVGVA